MHTKAKKNTAKVYKTGALSGKPYDVDMGCSCEPKYFYIKAIENNEVLWYEGTKICCCNEQSSAIYYSDYETAQRIANKLKEERKCDRVEVFPSAVKV